MITWHVYLLSPLYSEEAVAKWHLYPPPEGSYSYPWLWLDGRQRGWQYAEWPGYVDSALALTASVAISLSGDYDPGSRRGRVTAVFANSDTNRVGAVALTAVTEDSVFYQGTNGDQWHNHVLRDYVPDANGTTVSIAGLSNDTLSWEFGVDPEWNDQRCNVVVYLQETGVRPDSSRPVFQGALLPITQLAAAREKRVRGLASGLNIRPNPCRGLLTACLSGAGPTPMRLRVDDATGRVVREVVLRGDERSSLDLSGLSDGVYFISTRQAGSAKARVVLKH